jgi:hypothetical protein
MKERTVKQFSVVILAAMAVMLFNFGMPQMATRSVHLIFDILISLISFQVCLAAYTIAGVFGYLTFGINVPADILQAYDATKPYVLIAIIALAAKSCATYPILAFCGRYDNQSDVSKKVALIFMIREALMSLLQECFSNQPNGEKWGRNVISFLWFASSLVC